MLIWKTRWRRRVCRAWVASGGLASPPPGSCTHFVWPAWDLKSFRFSFPESYSRVGKAPRTVPGKPRTQGSRHPLEHDYHLHSPPWCCHPRRGSCVDENAQSKREGAACSWRKLQTGPSKVDKPREWKEHSPRSLD